MRKLAAIMFTDIVGYTALTAKETTKRIRETEAIGQTPIVALTSYAMTGDREKALNAGCTGYLEKPINPETFMADIEKFL